MNKEELFRQFINEHASEEYTSLVQSLTNMQQADFQLAELADYLHTYRDAGSVAAAIQELARKETKEAERKARIEEQRNKQVADPLAGKEEEQKPTEPTIKEDETNAFMCMCFIPTDVKQAIQDEMERRAENDPTLKAFLPDVSYTDLYNRIAAKLQDMAKSAPREGRVAAVHFSDADTYALAEYLIRNQITKREKAEKAKADAAAAAAKSAEKKKKEKKEEKKEEKVVPMVPTNASQPTETKKAETKKKDKPKEQDLFPSLFDF